jgi:hypothetical protein
MKEIKTREVDKYLYINYLKRSAELLKSSKRYIDDSIYAAASLNCVFSAVAAIDALCVYYLKKRHSGTNHEESIGLFMSVDGIKRQELAKIRPKLVRILKAKIWHLMKRGSWAKRMLESSSQTRKRSTNSQKNFCRSNDKILIS